MYAVGKVVVVLGICAGNMVDGKSANYFVTLIIQIILIVFVRIVSEVLYYKFKKVT